MSKLALSYDENESTMPPHVLLAHQSYTTTTLSAQELQCIPLPSSAVTAAAAAATAAAAGTPATTCVLLHSCCAPCSGAMIMEMSSLGLDITVFFYNPNIHPKKEYEIRKEENKKFAAKLQVRKWREAPTHMCEQRAVLFASLSRGITGSSLGCFSRSSPANSAL